LVRHRHRHRRGVPERLREQGTYEQGIDDYKVLRTKCPATGAVGVTFFWELSGDTSGGGLIRAID
jgi:chitinase